MNAEHTQTLFDEFSDLFRGRNKSLMESLMPFGFECEDGWFDIVYNLSKELAEYAKKNNCDIEASQVKEKFGTLRFYVRSECADKIYETIAKYEKLSASTCELCGEPGILIKKTGWYMTRCEKHKDITQREWTEI